MEKIMKLKLKHIAPYLPYNVLSQTDFGKGWNRPNTLTYSKYTCYAREGSDLRLLLHPLSYLTKEIEHNGEKFVPMERLKCIHPLRSYPSTIKSLDDISISYQECCVSDYLLIIEKLLEWHFNVFDLPQELWIDKNTIK